MRVFDTIQFTIFCISINLQNNKTLKFATWKLFPKLVFIAQIRHKTNYFCVQSKIGTQIIIM